MLVFARARSLPGRTPTPVLLSFGHVRATTISPLQL
jgi:hypothetical protein